jgi:hypothetical protein
LVRAAERPATTQYLSERQKPAAIQGGKTVKKNNMAKVNHGRFAVMRDLQDHLIAGKLNFFDLGIYTTIHWQADFKTGVWWGSAPRLHAIGPSGFSLRYVQRSIEKLTRIGFLKPFHKHGQRGNYPVLINKYEPLLGALRNFRLNAKESTDWRSPKYEPCALHDAVRDAVHDSERPPIHNAVSSTQEAEEKPAAKTMPPADPRFQPFVAFAHKTFEEKHGAKPSWLGKDFQQMRVLLKANASLAPVELERRWRAYLESSELFIAKQGDSLAYFATHCDTFSSGPIMQSEGKSNGRDINEAVATTMHGAFNSGITH